MKLSERLQNCADLVIRGNPAADIGTDHGFLPIYLIRNEICPTVIASDLREKPLEKARQNAAGAQVEDRIRFYLSDGLRSIPMDAVKTVICAGMGGDLITEILGAAKAWWTADRQFILQPQSAAPDLRSWLDSNGFRIREERIALDAGFLYSVMDVRWDGACTPRLNEGACFLPQGERTVCSGSLYRKYMERVLANTEKTVAGLRQAKHTDAEKLRHYEAGLEAMKKWEAQHENGQ